MRFLVRLQRTAVSEALTTKRALKRTITTMQCLVFRHRRLGLETFEAIGTVIGSAGTVCNLLMAFQRAFGAKNFLARRTGERSFDRVNTLMRFQTEKMREGPRAQVAAIGIVVMVRQRVLF